MAYLTDKERDSHRCDLLLVLSWIAFSITIIVIIITYCGIQIYLKFKHSKAIKIAEKFSNKSYMQILGFKKIIFGFLMLSICIGVSLKVNISGSRTNSNVPPTLIMNNMICNCLIIYYVVFRREVIDFIWRKIKNNNFVFLISFPRKKNLNKITPIEIL